MNRPQRNLSWAVVQTPFLYKSSFGDRMRLIRRLLPTMHSPDGNLLFEFVGVVANSNATVTVGETNRGSLRNVESTIVVGCFVARDFSGQRYVAASTTHFTNVRAVDLCCLAWRNGNIICITLRLKPSEGNYDERSTVSDFHHNLPVLPLQNAGLLSPILKYNESYILVN